MTLDELYSPVADIDDEDLQNYRYAFCKRAINPNGDTQTKTFYFVSPCNFLLSSHECFDTTQS